MTYDFECISKEFKAINEECEVDVKKHLIKKKIMPLNEFIASYQNAAKESKAELTPSKVTPKITEFTELFKALEEYPSNLHKTIKKTTTKHHHSNSRHNITAITDNTMTANVKDKEISICNTTKLEIEANKIFNDFRNYQQHLKAINTAIKKRDNLAEEFSNQLQCLLTFARNVEECAPAKNATEAALQDNEIEKLQQFQHDIEQHNSIIMNKRFFANAINNSDNDTQKILQQIEEILNYSLMDIK